MHLAQNIAIFALSPSPHRTQRIMLSIARLRVPLASPAPPPPPPATSWGLPPRYEFDIIRVLDNGTERSAHAWEIYNHHYANSIIGKGVKLVKNYVPYVWRLALRPLVVYLIVWVFCVCVNVCLLRCHRNCAG